MIDLNDRFVYKAEKVGEKDKSIFKYILKGVGISFVITMLLLVILSVVLTYTAVSESICDIGILVITGISILIGSSIANFNIGNKGLINGGLSGGIYIVLLYFLSSIATWDFAIGTKSLPMIGVGVVCGIIGGIFGVNISNKKK